MKKVLILGALAGQVDAVDTLRARGVETHVCAHVANGPGVKAADHFHVVDITDSSAVAELARHLEVDVVYSVGSDIAMPAVVSVSEELGLPRFHGVGLTDTLRRKQALREQLDGAGLSPVPHRSVHPKEATPDWDVFPCIVKPVDSQGQRGITIVRTAQELPGAIDAARASSVSGPVIIEEYLVGPEVSAHVLVSSGKVIFFLPSDRHVWEGPMVGVPRAHSLPLRDETAAWEPQLRTLVEDVVETLGVVEGPLYFQAILTDRGPRIIEIASRLDGCHLWRLVKLSTGVDIMDAIFGRLLGDPWPEFPERLQITPMTLEFFLVSPGTVVNDGYRNPAQRDDALFAESHVDDAGRVRATNSIVARLGYQIYKD